MREATIDVRFTARDVYLVLAPPRAGAGRGAGSVRVSLDGRSLRTIPVRAQRLERLVHLPRATTHRLTLRFSPGTSAYAFTFG